MMSLELPYIHWGTVAAADGKLFEAQKKSNGDGAMGLLGSPGGDLSRNPSGKRCWMHKTGNVLNTLPKSVQPKAKQVLHDI